MSDVFIVALLSGGAGAGLVLIARSLYRRPDALAERIAHLQHPGPSVAAGSDVPATRRLSAPGGVPERLGSLGRSVFDRTGLVDTGALRAKLRVLDKPVERHVYEKLLAGLALLVLPNAMAAVLAVAGRDVGPVYGLAAGAVLGTAGFFYPDYVLSSQLEARRQAFRHALASYVDLVSIALAGGSGIESALRGAAEAGDGWAWVEIRSALRRAELTGITPWQSFDDLGTTLGVEELRELAASVSLAGELGARVRQSLVAKADALRAKQIAEIEAVAEANTERMIGPAVMVLALTLFIFGGALGAINPTPAHPPDNPPALQP